MVERGQLLSKVELLKKHQSIPLDLPKPSTTTREDADLAARCRDAVVVIAWTVGMGASNDLVALPATGFFIFDTGMFVTSSHVIHYQDYDEWLFCSATGVCYQCEPCSRMMNSMTWPFECGGRTSCCAFAGSIW
jgi:hypothetical protein